MRAGTPTNQPTVSKGNDAPKASTLTYWRKKEACKNAEFRLLTALVYGSGRELAVNGLMKCAVSEPHDTTQSATEQPDKARHFLPNLSAPVGNYKNWPQFASDPNGGRFGHMYGRANIRGF